jgi:hypothetical protein
MRAGSSEAPITATERGLSSRDKEDLEAAAVLGAVLGIVIQSL